MNKITTNVTLRLVGRYWDRLYLTENTGHTLVTLLSHTVRFDWASSRVERDLGWRVQIKSLTMTYGFVYL